MQTYNRLRTCTCSHAHIHVPVSTSIIPQHVRMFACGLLSFQAVFYTTLTRALCLHVHYALLFFFIRNLAGSLAPTKQFQVPIHYNEWILITCFSVVLCTTDFCNVFSNSRLLPAFQQNVQSRHQCTSNPLGHMRFDTKRKTHIMHIDLR